MKVVKFSVDGKLAMITPKAAESAWEIAKRELGGAFLEPLDMSNGVVMLLDEDGRCKDLPVNERATALARRAYPKAADLWIVGDVCFVMDDGETYQPMRDSLARAIEWYHKTLDGVSVPEELPEPTVKIVAWS